MFFNYSSVSVLFYLCNFQTNKSLDRNVDVLLFHLSGNLANFGRISSKSELEFRIGGSILSLKDGHIDSAVRG